MSDTTPQSTSAGGADDTHHFPRLIAIWLVASAIADPIFWFVGGPHMPPGAETDVAAGNQFDFNILTIIAIPVMLAVWIYFGYAIVTWRASRVHGEAVGGAAARGNLFVQTAWIGLTSAIVMGLFVFGTVELIVPAGAGGGEGPSPVWTPHTKNILPIQVIAQQWKFTYRYPTYGGFETDKLVIPDNTTIAFHVTSLDVIHSFWAYQLSVKADANPQTDNVAFAKTQQLGRFTVRCNELCGLWHGAMFNYGEIVTQANFARWATTTEARLLAATKLLPPFAYTYTPDANGASGGFYPDCSSGQTSGCDPYSPLAVYGAKSSSA